MAILESANAASYGAGFLLGGLDHHADRAACDARAVRRVLACAAAITAGLRVDRPGSMQGAAAPAPARVAESGSLD